MRKKVNITLVIAIAFTLTFSAGVAYAENITIDDNMNNSYWGYTGHGVAGEDNEVSAGSTTGQEWDLEAVIFTNSTLTLIGGWKFSGTRNGWASGDLFLAFTDANSSETPIYGKAAAQIKETPTYDGIGNNGKIYNENYGYDFVLHLGNAVTVDGVTSIDYDAYNIESENGLVLSDVGYAINRGANPFKYVRGGQEVEDLSGTATQTRYSTDSALWSAYSETANSVYGGTHYALTFAGLDLSSFGLEAGEYYLWTHFTMGCGNDNLMGKTPFEITPPNNVPEPASIMLLLLGVAGTVARKRFFA